jgi:hypothetical protein
MSESKAKIINSLMIIPLGIYSIALDLDITKIGVNGLFFQIGTIF